MVLFGYLRLLVPVGEFHLHCQIEHSVKKHESKKDNVPPLVIIIHCSFTHMLVTATVFLVAVAQVDLSRNSANATDYRIKVSWGQCLIGIKAIVQKVLYPSELSF